MKSTVLIASAGLLAYGAWLMYQRQDEPATPEAAPTDDLLTTADNVLTGAGQSAAQIIDNVTGGALRLSNMTRVNPADLNNKNVIALLRVIRAGEGTAGETGYRTLFGGGLFESFADHPRQRITRKMGGRNITSTAAGAYQFLSSTWDETRRLMKLTDFSPRSQDLGALGRIAARGALEDVKAGRFDKAIKKIAAEWASMPGSPYGQPVISWDRARTIYASAGGVATA
jgi:muramidase (phage lysozyme)